jgi:hypothetical protein
LLGKLFGRQFGFLACSFFCLFAGFRFRLLAGGLFGCAPGCFFELLLCGFFGFLTSDLR